MTTVATRKIPADIWDALKESAEKHGGIGAGWYRAKMGDDNSPPLCIVGHAHACEIPEDRLVGLFFTAPFPFSEEYVTISVANDVIVARINRRKGHQQNARVPFDEYVAEMGWERADSFSTAP